MYAASTYPAAIFGPGRKVPSGHSTPRLLRTALPAATRAQSIADIHSVGTQLGEDRLFGCPAPATGQRPSSPQRSDEHLPSFRCHVAHQRSSTRKERLRPRGWLSLFTLRGRMGARPFRFKKLETPSTGAPHMRCAGSRSRPKSPRLCVHFSSLPVRVLHTYVSCRSRHRGSQVGYPTACQTGRPTRAIGVRDTHQWIGKAAQVIGSAGGRTHGSNLAGCCEEPGIQTTKVQCDSLITPPRPSHGYRQQGWATDLRVHVCFVPQYLPLSPRVNRD